MIAGSRQLQAHKDRRVKGGHIIYYFMLHIIDSPGRLQLDGEGGGECVTYNIRLRGFVCVCGGGGGRAGAWGGEAAHLGLADVAAPASAQAAAVALSAECACEGHVQRNDLCTAWQLAVRSYVEAGGDCAECLRRHAARKGGAGCGNGAGDSGPAAREWMWLRRKRMRGWLTGETGRV